MAGRGDEFGLPSFRRGDSFFWLSLAWTVSLVVVSLLGAAEVPERIVVADDKAYPPFAFLSPDGTPRGITIDIWNLWSRKTGIPVDFRLMDWDEALNAVREGRADAIGGLFRTPEREEHFDFPVPIHEISTAIFYHEQIGGLKGLEDLAGFPVACVSGDSAEELLRTRGTNLRVVSYPDLAAVVKDAAAGRVKVFVADVPIARFYLSQSAGGHRFRQSPNIDSNMQHVGIRKGNEALRKAIQSGFSHISKEELEEIFAEWSGRPAVLKNYWKEILWSLLGLSSVLAIIFVWNVTLRRKIRAATRDLEAKNRELQSSREEIRISEARFRLIFENAPYAIAINRLGDGALLEANRVFLQSRGFDNKQEALGLSSRQYSELIDETEENIVRDLLEKKKVLNRKARLRLQDGAEREIIFSSVLLDAEGDKTVLSMVVDVTEEKQAERALRAKTEELERYFNQSLDLLCVATTEGRFLRLNPEWERTLGYAISELENQMFLDLVHPDDLPSTLDTIACLSEQKAVLGFQNRYRHKDGSYRWIEWRSISQGNLIYAAARDITDRKQAEQAVSESERYLRAILQIAADGFWIIDCGGRLVEVNDAYCAMTGYGRDEILGLSIGVLDADETPDETASRIERIIAKGSETFEARHRRKNGEVFPIEVSATYIQERGGQFVCFGRDLSERRQREERIALLGRMLDAAPAAISIHNTEGRFLFANRETFAMHGYDDPEAFMAINLHDLDAPESEEKLAERFRQIAEEGEARFEVEHYRRDGSTFPLEVMAKAIEWHGQPAVLSIATDITERKRMEEDLAQTQALLMAAVEQTPAGILVADAPDVRIRLVNPAALGIRGDSPRSLKDIPIDLHSSRWQTFWPDGTPVAPEDLPLSRAVLKGETVTNMEVIICREDGETRYVLANAAPVRNAQGNIVAGVVVFPDITERKRAEQMLLRERERLQFVIDGSRLATWEWNIQTNETVFNETWARMLGYMIEELTPYNYETWLRLVCPEDREKAQDRLARCLRGEAPYYECEYRMLGKDGHWVWILDQGRVMTRDSEGQPLMMFGTHLDITERKRAEEEREKLREQLNQAQKMESVGRLAGGVAHDFNNMLNVILGHVDLALEELSREHPLRASLDEIGRAAQRSADLTRQLLAFARRQTIAPRVIDLNATIEGMLKMLRRLIGEDLELLWKPMEPLERVRVDPVQIDQLLANLCVNARDAVDEGGRITIETGRSEFDEDYCAVHSGFSPGRYVMLAVSDNGRGMDSETLSHLFEPFYTTKGVGEGTGLGLATVYGIVKQNKGFVNVYSELGRGSTFRIYLPVYEGGAVEEAAEPVEDVSRGHETVLLVEDEPAILALGTKMLDRLGYQTLAASTPGEALNLAREHSGEIHLLITDVVMPEMNGRDLARNLLSLYPNLKRLFMSGYTANVIAHQGVLDEGVNFLQKPFSFRELSAKVREALEG